VWPLNVSFLCSLWNLMGIMWATNSDVNVVGCSKNDHQRRVRLMSIYGGGFIVS
jgi:hypothetical protein